MVWFRSVMSWKYRLSIGLVWSGGKSFTGEKVTLSHSHKLTLRVSFGSGRINNNAAELRATAHHGGV